MLKKGGMSNVAGIRVANDIVGPFMARDVCVAGTHEFGLEGLELLEGAELVGHTEWMEGRG